MNDVNRQWVVARASQSQGIGLERECFGRSTGDIPTPADGEVLIRNVYFACDPMNHAWVKGLEARFEPIPVGQAMKGGIAGRVVASRSERFAVGDAVTGFLDWADYVVCDGIDDTGTALQKLPPGADLASGLATLGMTGQCAYLGLADFGKPQPGETVVVSGAAGAIGTVAGQIAGIQGARVIGIAGGPQKCAMLKDQLQFEQTIDYKNEEVADRLAALCPEGIDVFFDNVGGPILDAALANIAHGGRIVICGGISGYNDEVPGLQNHLMLAMRGAQMAGFFYFDYVHRFEEAAAQLNAWLREGKIQEVLDIAEGFDAVADAALRQFAGGNTGKQLVKIAHDPHPGEPSPGL